MIAAATALNSGGYRDRHAAVGLPIPVNNSNIRRVVREQAPIVSHTTTKAALELGATDSGDSQGRQRERDSALRDYYRRYRGELRRHVEQTFGKGPPEPEDVVQEAFARFAALPDHEAVGNPRAFLYQSARNVAIDEHRKIAVRIRSARELAVAPGGQGVDNRDAEKVLSDRQRLALIEATVRSLEPERRAVFVMNRVHGLSFAETARHTGMPETTVKRYVALALIACERALRAADAVDRPAGDNP